MTDVTIVELDTCDSTQDEVRVRLTSTPPGSLVAVSARSQRAGRGREGRTWQDPPGTAIMVSIGRRGPMALPILDDLPRRVADALLELLDAGGSIRWKAPNDLIDEAGAKLAGILVDARTIGSQVDHLVVGVGINVDAEPFTSDDGRPASSVQAAGGRPTAAADVIASLAELLRDDRRSA